MDTMTKYGKSINRNQLFTVGQEGFFAQNPKCNPTGVPGNVQPGWASRVSQGQHTDLPARIRGHRVHASCR